MKKPASLIRCAKGPVLAKLITQDDVFYVVEVCCKGGPKYALGAKQRVGYHWVIGPVGKVELWEKMKQAWDITIK